MREIYFHEDDFCMCELQPVSQYETIFKQMGLEPKLRKSNVINKPTVTPSPVLSLENLTLSYTQVYTLLHTYFTPFDKISNPVFLQTDLEPGNLTACAFGNTNENVVFFSFDRHTKIVKHIWFSFYPASKEALKDTKELLLLLRQLGDFLLVDWYAEKIVNLKEENNIDSYCKLLLTYS